MNRRDVLKLAPLAALSACASQAGKLPPSQTGWLVGSLGAKWNRSALVLGLGYAREGQAGQGETLTWSNQGVLGVRSGVELVPPEGSDDPLLGVQSQRLAPGRYVFKELITRPWELRAKDGNNAQELSVPFEIQAGRITYFGELAAWLTTQTPLFLGLAIPREAVLTLRDRSERDLTLLRRSGVALPEGAPVMVDWRAGTVPAVIIQLA